MSKFATAGLLLRYHMLPILAASIPSKLIAAAECMRPRQFNAEASAPASYHSKPDQVHMLLVIKQYLHLPSMFLFWDQINTMGMNMPRLMFAQSLP